MKNYPYVLSEKRLVAFIQKIPTMGVPQKVDQSFLSAAGFTTENDQRFLSVLKFLNFIESNGTPKENYKNYRGAKCKNVLANAIKSGYSELFNLYPNANTLVGNELKDFFSEKSMTGSVTVERIIMTFRALCKNADFSGSTSLAIEVDTDTSKEDTHKIPPKIEKAHQKIDPNYSSQTPIININIELSLPETKDSEVYDNLFAAMRKHLFR